MTKHFTSSTIANTFVCIVLALVPFHAFLTISASTVVGHYTLLRLWSAVLLLGVTVIVGWWLVRDAKLRQWLTGSVLARLVGAYMLLSVVLGITALAKDDVTLKALGYGLYTSLRFFVWFLAVLVVAQRSSFLSRNWLKIVCIPAVIVVVFGILQYTVLPHNFLSHFGYNAATTIAPIETINSNAAYIRVQSTLRGANPLGTYLVLIVSTAAVYILAQKRLYLAGFALLTGLFTLYASGSRGAWIGTIVSLAVVAGMSLRRSISKMLLVVVGVVIVTALIGAYFGMQHNRAFQNAIFHTEDRSTVAVSSNDAHASAVLSGIKDVGQQSLGAGPGTAGPASVYNGAHQPRIAENYYVQVAQETGWLGLALFVAISTLVAWELYTVAKVSRLALIVFASGIGLIVVNLVSHAWTDDTLAYLWWGLAGIALSSQAPKKSKIS